MFDETKGSKSPTMRIISMQTRQIGLMVGNKKL